MIRKVRNTKGINDPVPAVVSLPAGSYNIRAEARDHGRVVVPVVIRSGESTIVNLQRGWKPAVAQSHANEFVWFDGRAVGWRVP